MENRRHNGWTNYETWRVNADILSDVEFDESVDALMLQEFTESMVFDNYTETNSLIYDFAKSFLSEVNYYEIADSINHDINTNKDYNGAPFYMNRVKKIVHTKHDY